ncbi:hypothetical protein CFOL_v3_05258 [Cephalotus follicularis]|uniref:Uncharacterized protein n=1 Tax=Cephalotus follicularis TaxID=3775 RepID=A0A1Q3B1S4_CEPFO|nr:hypothetical protein CFOL_v3_05258 [Cephalotus follicularis]
MGTCLSKKDASSSSSTAAVAAIDPCNFKSNDAIKVDIEPISKKTHKDEGKQEEEESTVKKEIFIIKHRKSHDRDRRAISPPPQRTIAVAQEDIVVDGAVVSDAAAANTIVRTSSCTKEEVDAILIQCGRLSRSNSSGGKAPYSAKKYSGSKRSYDFDTNGHDDADYDGAEINDVDDDEAEDKRQHRQRHRQSPRPSSSSQGRRRTPSREREQQQRSGSRERATSSGSGRRVSRSPGRRSENNNNQNASANKPSKMVSVPATVSSLTMDKSNNAVEPQATTTTVIKRISVKRNAGEGPRNAASPRSQSPVRANARGGGANENQQQPSLSRSSSRKADQSPYRRNPLSEIDPNSLAYPQLASNKTPCTNALNQAPMQKPNVENKNDGIVAEVTNYKSSSRSMANNKAVNQNYTAKEQQQILEETETQPPIATHVSMTVVADTESLKPQTLTRSRSSRRSRDLDHNPETLLNPTAPSYTTLLLEDIQNFHQKKATTPSFTVPPCVSKACSILEAVADLNSTTSSNLSCAFSEDRKDPPTDQSNKNVYTFSSAANLVGKRMSNVKDPFVESEVLGNDDLMEPSFHKYVTVRRGGTDMEEQESSGSNSIVCGGQQHWGFSPSSLEPNSADSTDRWTSRSNTREDDQRNVESGRDVNKKTRKELSGKKSNNDHQKTGIGRGRIGAATKGLHTVPAVVAAAST